MSYFNRLVVLAFFGLLMVLCLPVDAQFAPLAVGAGNLGNGITDTWYSTVGVGSASNTDSFVNSVGSPLGLGCGFPAFGGCGFTPFGGFSPLQLGLGGNWGFQDSAATGAARAQSFGLQPIGLVFGIPVAGPGGCVYT